MGNENMKEQGGSSPNDGSLAISESAADDATDSRAPSTNASVASGEQEDQPNIRKSKRKRRVSKRLQSPSPPPPPLREKKAASKPPPKKIARQEPPKHVLMTIPKGLTKRPPSPDPSSSHEDFFVDSEEDDDEDTRSDSSSVMSEDPSRLPWEPAGVYSSLLRLRQQRHFNCIPVIPLPSRTIGGVRDQLEKTKVCNCKRSNCLKLYCDCFMASLYCTADCKCIDCKNNVANPRDRNFALDLTLVRNPNAFRPRPAIEAASTSNPGAEKGCNCKKSSCLKKYCECFLDSVYCSTLCGCVDCKNKVGNKEREELMAERRSRAKNKAESAQTKAAKEVRQAHGGETVATAAARTAVATAAKGVDLFLPPSHHSQPMTLAKKKKYPMVAFTKASLPPGVNHPSYDGKKMKSKSKKKQKSLPRNDKYKYETDLEKLWRVETDRVEMTFERAYNNVQSELSSSKYSFSDAPSNTARDVMIDYRARMTVAHVMEDMKDIVTAVNQAETSAIKFWDEKKEQESAKQPKDHVRPAAAPLKSGKAGATETVTAPPDESALLCEESLGSDKDEDVSDKEDDELLLCEEKIDDSKGRELTGDAVRELTVLAVQEAALIRELAGIVRRNTIALTSQRLRLVENARKKASS